MTPFLQTAIVGATGAVGMELLEILEARAFPAASLRLMASARSAGKTLEWKGKAVEVEDLAKADPAGLDVAFFCAGAERSRAFAPAFSRAGAWVIDNSSAFRQDPEIALVVPEINAPAQARDQGGIIANPNCSTIIALLPLAALHKAFGLARVLLSTYQAVSGAGAAALEELDRQTRAAAEGKTLAATVFPRPILHNLIPWIGPMEDSGFCEEETKATFESRKIMGLPGLKISATTVRVPVRRCHSISTWVKLEKEADEASIRAVLKKAPGVVLEEIPPCPAEVEGTDQVHVGRIRSDPHEDRAFWLWTVSDQIRKGAALNAVQIAESLYGVNPNG